MLNETCCVKGRRDIPADKVDFVKSELRREIIQAIEDGYIYFMSGFDDGVDMYFAAIVAELMRDNEALHLEAVIPYRRRFFQLMENAEAKALIGRCTTVGIHSEEYFDDCVMRCNRFMVATSGRIIAVYGARKRDDTLATMREAYAQERDVRVIKI